MSTPLLGVSLQPRWPLEDGTAVLRAAGHAEDLGFDHAILQVLASDGGDVSQVLEGINAPFATHPEGWNDDPRDSSDLLSVIADQGAEDD